MVPSRCSRKALTVATAGMVTFRLPLVVIRTVVPTGSPMDDKRARRSQINLHTTARIGGKLDALVYHISSHMLFVFAEIDQLDRESRRRPTILHHRPRARAF